MVLINKTPVPRMESKISSLAFLVLLVFMPKLGLTSLTIERRSDFSDRIVEKGNSEIEKNSIHEDGSCLDSEKRTISSRFWTNMITCFTDPELKTLGNEVCKHSITVMEKTQRTMNFCKVRSILEISVWNLKEWQHFRYEIDRTLRTEVNITDSKLLFENRRKWDGILMRIFVRCATNHDVICVSIKFTGLRNYPLPSELSEILQQMEPSSTATTITAAPVTSKKTETSSKVYIVVCVVCILVILIVLVLFYVRRKLRSHADRRKRRDPSIRDKSDESAQIELQMLPEAEYAAPNQAMPEYSELEPLCDDATDRFRPIKNSIYDTPKQSGTGKWPPAGYRVPSVSTEEQEPNDLPEGDQDNDQAPIV